MRRAARAPRLTPGQRRLRYRFDGPDDRTPLPGHLLQSVSGRAVYRILVPGFAGRRVAPYPHALFRMVVERVPRSALEEAGAVVLPLHWEVRRDRPGRAARLPRTGQQVPR